MYTLYYTTENLQLSTIEVDTLDNPILIPENLHFVALRNGINFIDEPDECVDFTNLERLAISKRLDDLNIFKDEPFRLKNTYLTNHCTITPPPPALQTNYLVTYSSQGGVADTWAFPLIVENKFFTPIVGIYSGDPQASVLSDAHDSFIIRMQCPTPYGVNFRTSLVVYSGQDTLLNVTNDYTDEINFMHSIPTIVHYPSIYINFSISIVD